MKPSPDGSRSCTVTLLAGSGPALVRETVKGIVATKLGVVLLTVLVTARSACWGVSVALALLSVGSGSNWSLWLMLAVLVWGAGLATRARRVSVAGAPVSTWPTVHSPVVLS